MALFILSSLLLIGLLLVLIEIIFVPGATIVGLLGILFSALGVIYAFITFGESTGWYALGGTILVNLIVLIFGLRSNVWERLALKDTLHSRSHDDRLLGLEVGQKGKTISDLKPYGKAMFNDKIYEVKSENGFISPDTEIYIFKLESNRIIIKQ
ncbi:NfeD family protein [Anditalea andensis]|uniref:Nodulation protein NfeD n=1 Tax=Anditalea andensis TaxID=1048983 RepID=A0A074LLU5_9BACT|nr:NfeD family protein [Anditalea andensis]KEO74847.1 nodulation protein NfeD [Anditalea andensis]